MLYNNASIFVGTSLGEGWGLTLCEAMQCGCAIVCTNVFGYNEFAFDKKNALLCESKNSNELAKNIITLIENNELRYRLADNGYENIKDFTWEKSYNKLKKIL